MADVLLSLKSRFEGKAFVEARAHMEETGKAASDAMMKAADGMKVASATMMAMQGNFSGAAKTALMLAANLKLVSASATAIAGFGLLAVQQALAFVEKRAKAAQEELEKLSDKRTDKLAEDAERTAEAYRKLADAMKQAARLSEIGFGFESTVLKGEDKLAVINLEKQRQAALAAAPDADSRAAVNREFDARRKLLELEQKHAEVVREIANQSDRDAMLAQRRAAAEARIAEAKGEEAAATGERKKWEETLEAAKDERERLGKRNDDASRWLDRVSAALGMESASPGEKWEDFEKRVNKQIDKLKEREKAAGKAVYEAESGLADVVADEESAKTAHARLDAEKAEVEAQYELAEAAAKTAEMIAAQEAAGKRQAENDKKRLEAEKNLQAAERELAGLEERHAADRERREDELIKKRLEDARKIAGLTVGQNIERRKAAKEADKAERKDARKARRLEAAEARGVRLSRGNREWLDARREIQQAQNNAAKEAAALQAREDARQAAIVENIRKAAEEVRNLKDKLVEVTTCQ